MRTNPEPTIHLLSKIESERKMHGRDVTRHVFDIRQSAVFGLDPNLEKRPYMKTAAAFVTYFL